MKLQGGPMDGIEVGNPPSDIVLVPELRTLDRWISEEDIRIVFHPDGEVELFTPEGEPLQRFVQHTYRREGDQFVWDHVSQ